MSRLPVLAPVLGTGAAGGEAAAAPVAPPSTHHAMNSRAATIFVVMGRPPPVPTGYGMLARAMHGRGRVRPPCDTEIGCRLRSPQIGWRLGRTPPRLAGPRGARLPMPFPRGPLEVT